LRQQLLGKISIINPPRSDKIKSEDTCSFVPMEFVDDESGVINRHKSCRVRDVENGFTPFLENDVLFAKITPCMENGKCAIARNLINGVGFGSTEFHVLRAKEDTTAEWIYYYLRQEIIRKKAERAMTGSAGQKRVPTRFLEEALIYLPPLSEQNRLAGILEKADRLRRLRRYAHQLSDAYPQSVFLEMFGDPRTYPTKYPIIPLGKACDVRDGTHESPSYVQKGYPLVTSKNLVNGYVDLHDANFISKEDYVQINKRSKVDKGDILMPMIGTIGNPVLVDRVPNYAIKNVALIKFIESSPRSLYIRELLRGYYFDFITSKSSRGGTQQFIALDDIRNFPIPLPSDEEQSKFNQIVQKFERLRSQQYEAEHQADHLFQTLLHKAFQGELG